MHLSHRVLAQTAHLKWFSRVKRKCSALECKNEAVIRSCLTAKSSKSFTKKSSSVTNSCIQIKRLKMFLVEDVAIPRILESKGLTTNQL